MIELLKENWKVQRTCHVFEVTKTDLNASKEFQSLEMLNTKNFSCLTKKVWGFYLQEMGQSLATQQY